MNTEKTESSAKKDWRLEDLTLADVRQLAPQLAVLPMGATEPHNLHLPYGTDTIEAGCLADRCCEKAQQLGARVIQLPVIPYGTETNMRELPLAMNLNPSTLAAILTDLIDTLEKNGILKLLILNSHGGNDFKPFLREMYGKTKVQLFLCNWYQMISDVGESIFDEPEDHAGEMETSLILSFRPELVAITSDGRLTADEGARRPLAFKALQEGWVSMTRPWHLLTTNSGSGNPHAASVEKGQQVTEAIVNRIAPFLHELAEAEIDSDFPFA